VELGLEHIQKATSRLLAEPIDARHPISDSSQSRSGGSLGSALQIRLSQTADAAQMAESHSRRQDALEAAIRSLLK